MTIQIVSFAPIHFPVLSTWFASEAEAVRWGGTGVRFPLDTLQLVAMFNEGRVDPPKRLCWMAEDATGVLVGHAQLGFDWRNGNARLSRVVIAPAARGLGLARPMLSLVIGEAFARSGIERIELSVFTPNAPATRTYTALGFAHEGTQRSSTRVGIERWDAAIMGLLKPEWQNGFQKSR